MENFPHLNSDYWTKFWIEHGQKTSSLPQSQMQVLRTINGQGVTEDNFAIIVEYILKILQLKKTDVVLDLCCGNGLITEQLATQVKSVLAVDCSHELLNQIDLDCHSNIRTFQQDIRQLSLIDQKFDKIMIYAGIQYFSENEIIILVKKCYDLLLTNGLLLIGDVPDRNRLWNFFNLPDREEAYFNAKREQKPIIGTWIEPEWMIKLGQFIGYKKALVFPQPDTCPYSHYRFDILYQR